MKRQVQVFFTLCALTLFLAGCGSDEAASDGNAEPSTAEKAASGLKAMRGLGDAVSKMQEQAEHQQNFKTEPVDFRTLRDLLPESVAGLERTDLSGEKQATMGMSISKAEATYTGEDNRRITMTISDMGGVTAFAMLGFGWALAEVDRESSSGYEKTTTYRGHKAHEKYDRERERGEMQTLVADRFVVEVEGRAVEMDAVKEAMDAVDVGTLEGMKDEGVTRRES